MLRIVTPPEHLTHGRLYLCSMPGRLESLNEFLAETKQAGINHVMCLVSDEEIARKSPDYLGVIGRNELPARLWRFKITDYGLPADPDELDRILDLIWERMDAGESVVIHCAAGHGRTGTVSPLLLARMGVPIETAIETIRLAGSAPDTPEQLEFIYSRVAAWARE